MAPTSVTPTMMTNPPPVPAPGDFPISGDRRSVRRHDARGGGALHSTFGRGSVISERTLSIEPGKKGEFRRLSAEIVWPWLEAQGGRVWVEDPTDGDGASFVIELRAAGIAAEAAHDGAALAEG